MKNKEKYHDEIFEIACRGSSVAMSDGKLCACFDITCNECDFNKNMHDIEFGMIKKCVSSRRKWFEAEYEEPAVDWSKVPVDTKIYVSLGSKRHCIPRYFAGCTKDGEVGAWTGGKMSFTSDKNEIAYWCYAKLAEDAKCD